MIISKATILTQVYKLPLNAF